MFESEEVQVLSAWLSKLLVLMGTVVRCVH